MSMKYIKLFESWLNEVDEKTYNSEAAIQVKSDDVINGKSEMKPFDPKKPDETLVVDIDGFDLSVDDSKYASRIIASILGRCVKKDEKGNDPELTVIRMKIDDVQRPNQGLATIFLKDGSGSDFKRIQMIIPSELSVEENTYVYYISKYTSDDWVNDKGLILHKPKTFLVFDTGGIEEGFALNREFTIIDWSKESKNLPEPIKTTLGGICALATTNFENLAILKDTNEAKPQNIAKALGYEIPENYTPKQGVTKREERS